MDRYRTFKRSANSFEEFATARKITVSRNVSWEEARRQCDEFNDNRTAAQIKRGTKLEFEDQR